MAGTNGHSRWQNRIVGEDMVEADQLLANPTNWRIHPKHQQAALAGVLDNVGWVQRVIVNQRTGHVIDGHLRASLAISRGEQVPVIYVDVDEDEERLILATLDPLAAMAATDAEMLEGLLRGLGDTALVQDDEGLRELLGAIAGEAGIALGNGAAADPGAQVDRAEELREAWQTERGQVWEVPSATVPGRAHRVMCGDSTSAEDVARLMAGEKAAFVFTDPPYGAEYMGGTKKWDKLVNDDVTDMYGSTLPIIAKHTDSKAAVYLAFSDAKARAVYNAIHDADYEQRALIIWNKNLAQFGAMGSQYKQKHEPIAYLHKHGEAPYWVGPNNEVTVWDIARESANEFHPTQKPPELVRRAMGNSAPQDCLCMDLFIGSGTTIVAAEQTGRICYGMEIEPKYVAVTLQRLADMGLEPVLVNESERT